MLPPGRARLATSPVPTGSLASPNTIGMIDVACFAAMTFRVPDGDDIDLQPDQLSCDLGGALTASLRPAIFDGDRAALDPAEFAQPLQESGGPWLWVEGVFAPRKPMVGTSPVAARAPRAASRRRAAEKGDELPPS